MILVTKNHTYKYEIEKLCRIFLPFEKIEITDSNGEDSNRIAVTELERQGTKIMLSASLVLDGKNSQHCICVDGDSGEDVCELELATQLFHCFTEITCYKPLWGILTGVRPAKLYSRLFEQIGENKTDRYFREKLFVSNEKISLCKATRTTEEEIIALSQPRSFSLYIAIPFCPSRCSYCSFVSHSVEQAGKLIPQYVEYLCREIEKTAEIARNIGLRLETIYMGGGTPTTLTATQMETVLSTVRSCFDLSYLREFTVEAGRPDTVTAEKLCVLKKCGVGRISINPQTMNDEVLAHIGRRHTVQQTIDAFMLARSIGFDNINADLIAGLPSDTAESFSHSLDTILTLDPESVTVHALSMKRSSRLSSGGIFPCADIGEFADGMVNDARSRLTERGIVPYYMYRQGKTVGNLENVGYAKRGYECLYNVFIMDETHSVLACGASGVTKLREPGGNYIERIFNYKYPYEYMSGFDEMTGRKERIYSFYEDYGRFNK